MTKKISTVITSVLAIAGTAMATFSGITGKPPITTSKPLASFTNGTAICFTIFGVASCDQKVNSIKDSIANRPKKFDKVCPGSDIFCSPEVK